MRIFAALGGLRRHIVSIVPIVRAVQQAARLVDDYERDRNLDQLDTAIDVLRGAPGPTLPPGAEDSNRASLLAVLSQALTARFEAVGEPADLDEAVRAGRDAVGASRPGERRHFMIQSILGVALAMQFERNGEPADLDEAIIALRESAAAAPTRHAMRPRVLTNLGGTLRTRFTEFGDPADLAEAITTERSAVSTARLMHLDCLPAMSNLGAALPGRRRGSHPPSPTDPDVSLSAYPARAVQLSGRVPQRPVREQVW